MAKKDKAAEAALENQPGEQTVEQLAAENAELRKQLEAANAKGSTSASADDKLIRAKQAKGLSREQAEAVVRNQRAFEARKKALKK